MEKEQAFELDLNVLLRKVEQSNTPCTAELRAKKARQFIRKNVRTETDRSLQLLDRVSSAYLAALNTMGNKTLTK